MDSSMACKVTEQIVVNRVMCSLPWEEGSQLTARGCKWAQAFHTLHQTKERGKPSAWSPLCYLATLINKIVQHLPCMEPSCDESMHNKPESKKPTFAREICVTSLCCDVSVPAPTKCVWVGRSSHPDLLDIVCAVSLAHPSVNLWDAQPCGSLPIICVHSDPWESTAPHIMEDRQGKQVAALVPNLSVPLLPGWDWLGCTQTCIHKR